jgi:hypothetical protein
MEDEESVGMKWMWIGVKAAYSLLYILLTMLPSFFGPKLGDPRNVVDPSSLFHFINFVFVRLGFLLSLGALLCLATANERLRARPPFKPLRDGAILAGLVVYWLAWRLLFVAINDITGSCQFLPHQRKPGDPELGHRECLQNGGYWDGFDISGHCFLMALTASLFFDEILRSARWLWGRWQSGHNSPVLLELGRIDEKYGDLHEEEDDEAIDGNNVVPSTNDRQCLSQRFWRWLQWLGIGLVALLWIAWTALLVHTSLYFHTFWEKIWGILIGLSYWWLLIVIQVS